ncbi:MAG TPA: ABC transporter permease, partial [Sphingomonadales bacterium]|nr:ABC transporter permease [Sphingomonadales bacterium]
MRVSFAWERLAGLVKKEFIQLKRDRPTFAMLIGIPFMQLMLFGYAINADPKELPAAVVAADESIFVRSYVKALENTGYFRFTFAPKSYAEAESLMLSGKVQYIVSVSEDFTRKLVRGEQPEVLMEVDATDPIASSNAMAAASLVTQSAFRHDLKGVFADLAPAPPPVDFRMHRKFNPENFTHYNTVPGLIGVILTMTLVMITALALARERERGTLENLYAMPLKPIEAMAGKIVPFIIGASIQVVIVLAAAKILFDVPMFGSFTLLSL